MSTRYEVVPVNLVLKGQETIGSRLVFEPKADGRFKARIAMQGYLKEAGASTTAKTSRRCAVSVVNDPC